MASRVETSQRGESNPQKGGRGGKGRTRTERRMKHEGDSDRSSVRWRSAPEASPWLPDPVGHRRQVCSFELRSPQSRSLFSSQLH